MTTSWHWQAYATEHERQALNLGLPLPFPTKITHFRKYIANLRHHEGKTIGVITQGGKVRGITVGQPFAMFEHCLSMRIFLANPASWEAYDVHHMATDIFSYYFDVSHLMLEVEEDQLVNDHSLERLGAWCNVSREFGWQRWLNASTRRLTDGFTAKSICLLPLERLTVQGKECHLVEFPLGAVFVEVTKGAVTRIDFWRTGERTQSLAVLQQGLKQHVVNLDGTLKSDFAQSNYVAPEDAPIGMLASVLDELASYFAGKKQSFDLPYAFLHGTEFQKRVWSELRLIPYGQVISYEDLATQIAKPGQKPQALARAVGAACSANPLPIMVPCHRVIGKDNRLIGYNGGVEIKALLLDIERLGQS